MFVDASVIIALIDCEPGYEEIEKRMRAAAGPFYVSQIARYEATIGLARKRAAARKKQVKPSPALVIQARATVDQFIKEAAAKDVVISSEISAAAIEASARYGKIAGHPAKLNFGDCFAYACAKTCGVDLLYKGNDFAHTDLA